MSGVMDGPARGRSWWAGGLGAVLAAGLTAAMFGAFPAAASTGRAAPAAAVAGSLAAVSCASATNCIAVGGRSPTSTSSGNTLAEKWNGTTWSVVTSVNPSGADGARLYGVDCTSTSNCLAVGVYYTASRTSLPMAEKWNGSKWSLVTVPAPSGATDASLDAIACTSATNCWGAGVSGVDTLIERWNGTKWSIVTSPNPNPAKSNVLSGVTCASATECWAVGYYFPGDDSGSLTEKWNGSAWSVVTTPNSASGELIGDDCSGTSACLAVGISDTLFAIAQKWNGTKWADEAPKKPSGASDSELNGVSCTASTSCQSVGNYYNGSISPALAESWNGTTWTIEATPAISGATYVSLAGVSCATASDCWAVGESITSSGTTSPLLEEWNGKTWSRPS
jgi:hypothetical protein